MIFFRGISFKFSYLFRMEENTVIARIDLTPIETVSNNSTILFDKEIRLNIENGIQDQRKYPIDLFS